MDGVINVYKPVGMTSHDVVNKVRRIAGTKKVGHTGTLDPDAEGVLPVCINRATKLADMLTFSDKRYTGYFKLGITTDTQDISGEVLTETPVNVSIEEIKSAIMSFKGNISQIPPMYSALKVNGKKLCDLARNGIEVERKARKVTIYDINILYVKEDNFTIDVKCSKGTYIRTLGHDIGQKLGCGAVMTKLVRTASSVFTVDKSVKLDDLNKDNFKDYLIPADSLLEYKSLTIDGENLRRVLNGNAIEFHGLVQGEKYKVYNNEGTFLCVSYYDEGLLKVEKMFFVGD